MNKVNQHAVNDRLFPYHSAQLEPAGGTHLLNELQVALR